MTTAQMSRRPRIALVLNRFWPEVGGAETNLYFQAVELARHFDVTVFTPKRLVDELADEQHRGFRIRRLKDWLNRGDRFPNLGAKTFMPGLVAELVRGRFDVIQAFPSINHNSLLAFFVAKLTRTTFMLCSFDFLDYAGLIRDGGGHLDVNVISRHVATRREALVLRHADHVCAISQRELAFFRRYTERASYSPVPVLTDEYTGEIESPRARYGIRNDEFVYLCLGRVSQIKGQDIAVEAFIRNAGNAPDSRLVIVGRSDYEEGFASGIRDRIAAAGLGDRVLFTGMVERPEVIGWLAHADAHVIPVRFMNSGAVVAETWAAGTVVIQSDAVDPNYVVDGENGYLFRSESADHAAAQMLRAYRNRRHLAPMAARGREFVMRHLTYERLVEIYRAIYAQIAPKAFSPGSLPTGVPASGT
jgi:glycosyltransferase involved in cell wall biosynthesis